MWPHLQGLQQWFSNLAEPSSMFGSTMESPKRFLNLRCPDQTTSQLQQILGMRSRFQDSLGSQVIPMCKQVQETRGKRFQEIIRWRQWGKNTSQVSGSQTLVGIRIPRNPSSFLQCGSLKNTRSWPSPSSPNSPGNSDTHSKAGEPRVPVTGKKTSKEKLTQSTTPSSSREERSYPSIRRTQP